jgi:hypothetical protein
MQKFMKDAKKQVKASENKFRKELACQIMVGNVSIDWDNVTVI